MSGWLASVARVTGSSWNGFLATPSLFWISTSDAMLRGVTVVGVLRLVRYHMTRWSDRRDGWWTRENEAASTQESSLYLRPLALGDPDPDAFLRAHRLNGR